jgi:hypothetical protein
MTASDPWAEPEHPKAISNGNLVGWTTDNEDANKEWTATYNADYDR